jgi:Tol biopolymer transport system component
VKGEVGSLSWSPDGKTIRLTVDHSLWEMSANGSNFHQLLVGWAGAHTICCGHWSPDGAFFLFKSSPGSQLWALDERRGLFRRPPGQPVRLTFGPIRWGSPVPSKDGKKIFSAGYSSRGELVRFDSKSNQFQPFLGGISANLLSFSKDGQTMAYVSYPEDVLWKANKDGSNPTQLSDPPLYPESISLSPDGSQVLFMASSPKGIPETWIVSSQGGSPRRLLPEDNEPQTDPNWSPDGRKVIFATNLVGARNQSSVIRILDLDSHQVTTIPGSAGMFSPHWSPNGQSIAASSLDIASLYLFDMKTQRWSTLYKGLFAYATWSRDSRFIYFLSYVTDPAVLRITATGGKAESIATLKDFKFAGTLGLWFGLDPADSPLLLRDIGISNVYALTLEPK